MGLEKKHQQANELQSLLFPVGFKDYLHEVFPAGISRHKALNILKLGLDYVCLREAAAQRSR